MATWDIAVFTQTSVASGNKRTTPITPPGDFDGAAITDVSVVGSPTLATEGATDDTIGVRWRIETTASAAVYGGFGSDAASLCSASLGDSALSDTITDSSFPGPAPTTAVAADWDRVAGLCNYTANMMNDGETCSWATFTIRVTYTPPSFIQRRYRFATPITGGAHEAWTLVGTENVSFEIATAQLDVGHALIVKVSSEGFNLDGEVFQLEYNVDGGGWNDVNATSSNVRTVGSGDTDNATSTTERLNTSILSFQNSVLDEGNGAVATPSFGTLDENELYFAIEFRSADLSGGESITFRVTNATATTTTTTTPTATIEAAGGTINEVTKTDTIAVPDADVKLRLRDRGQLDTHTATDSQAILRQRIREVLDAHTVTDSAIAVKVKASVLTDTIAVPDSQVMLRQRIREILDTHTVTDSPVMLRERIREILFNITVLDNSVPLYIPAAIINEVTKTDEIAVPDSQVMLRQRIREALENHTVTDFPVMLRERIREVLDTHTVTDSQVLVKLAIKKLLDNAAVIDSNIELRTRIRQALDNIDATDNSIGIRSAKTVLGDSVNVVDPTDKLRLRERDLLDNAPIDLGLETIRKRVVKILNNVVETNITDNLIAVKTKAPAILSDTIAATDDAVELRLRFRLLLDEIAVTDSAVATKVSETITTLLDEIAVTDSAIALRIKSVLLGDTIALTDSAIEFRNRFWSLLDVIDVIDSAIIIRNRSSDILDEISVTDAEDWFKEARRIQTDEISVTDAEDWFRLVKRVSADIAALTDDSIELRERYRTLLDDLDVTDSAVAGVGGVIARTLTDVIAVVDSLVILRQRFRELLDDITVTDDETWFKEARRIITESIDVSDIALIPEIGTILQDSVDVTDASDWYKLSVRKALDEIAATDAETWFKEARRVLTESIAVTDAALIPGIKTILQDAIDAVDANVELRLRNRILTDSITVIDNVVVQVSGVISRTLLNEIAVIDDSLELRLRDRLLIEYGGRRNKFDEVNDLDSGGWSTQNSTITLSATAPPTGVPGLTKAWDLKTDATVGQHWLRFLNSGFPSPPSNEVVSIYVRPGPTYDGMLIQTFASSNHQRIGFDLTTGQQRNQQAANWDDWHSVKLNDGWWRFDAHIDDRGTSQDYIAFIVNDDPVNSGIFSGDGTGITIAGPQLEESDEATPVIVNGATTPIVDFNPTDTLHASAIRIKVAAEILAAIDSATELRLRNRLILDAPTVTDNIIPTHIVGGIIVNAVTVLELLNVVDATDAEKIFNMTRFAIKHGIDRLQVDDGIENLHILNKIRRET